ncbi:hypothetical protein AB9Q10_25195 [Streptomyces krungchingensis]|uniref:hypothetical protein n=1 Tax=Streptomyces krungchingensis TaxID=1565034 RepID=UPI003CE9B00F
MTEEDPTQDRLHMAASRLGWTLLMIFGALALISLVAAVIGLAQGILILLGGDIDH